MNKVWAQVVAAVVLGSSPALADPNDFRIHQLGNPATDPSAHANFRAFARELGAAITSVNLTPPETLGHAAFSVTGELSVVNLDTTSFNFPTTSVFEGPLLMPSIHIRKGLPFSFELGGRMSWFEKSRMGAGTLEGKWAFNEGFALLPDVAARLSVTRLFNTADFDLTTVGLDLGVGKQVAIGGMITLTPYAGWNLVWVGANTQLVDFDPGRTYDASVSGGTSNLAGQGYSAYDDVPMGQNVHNRFYLGGRFVGGVIQLMAELSYSVLGKIRVEDPISGTTSDRALPGVLAFNFAFGLDF
jgi:hypothetical protein